MLNSATARRTPLSVAEKARHSPALGAKIRFAFKKDGAARCPRRVILYRASRSCPARDVCFAPEATESASRRNMSRWAQVV